MSTNSLIDAVAQDILSDSDKRILAILPVSRIGGPVVEVELAYAFQPEGQPERYFQVRATRTGVSDWAYAPYGRRELTTARGAVEACLYSTGYGGRTPRPIKVD